MISAKVGFQRRYKIPARSKKITKAKARLIAHLLGDGGVYKNKICYRNSEPRLIEQFIQDFQSVYGVRPWKKYWDENKFATGSGIVEVIQDLRKYVNKIPPKIMNANKAIQKEFIRAFSDDEGGPITRNRIRITSTNKSYLSDISKMLKNFGVQSVINGPYHRGEFLLDINRKESVSKYIHQIGFLHPLKAIKAKQIDALLSKNI
jgi:intein/homing endonuclease